MVIGARGALAAALSKWARVLGESTLSGSFTVYIFYIYVYICIYVYVIPRRRFSRGIYRSPSCARQSVPAGTVCDRGEREEGSLPLAPEQRPVVIRRPSTVSDEFLFISSLDS